MKIAYYPGCTLKSTAKNFEISAIAVAKELGIEFVELSRWNCCGTVYSMTSDDVMHHLAPIRNLIRVKEDGFEKVVTLCSMCFNTLKRANILVQREREKLDKINDFMYLENIDYAGDVEVLHLLEILRDDIGWEEIMTHVKNPLNGLVFAPYYGCLLVRPPEVAIDNVEMPYVLDRLFESLGAKAIDYPYSTECCGAYNTVSNPDIVLDRTYTMVNLARQQGADAIILSCPLCDFNLEIRQKKVMEKYPDFHPLPVLYFTQIMAVAFGLPENTYGFEYNSINPEGIFKKAGERL